MVINIIVLPLLTIVFISGLSAAFVGLLSIKIGSIIVIPAILVLKMYTFICELAQQLPYSKIIVGCPSLNRVIIYYIILAILIYICKKNKSVIIRLFGIITLLVIVNTKVKSGLEIDFLDVGQGDASYIHIDSGQNIFVDGGSSSKKKVGENIILPFLKYRGIGNIDYWFISHADSDHVSGLIEVINSGYCIDNIIIGLGSKNDENMMELVSLANDFKINIIEIKSDDCLKTDSAMIECVNPSKVMYSKKEEYNSNENCLVLLLSDYKTNTKCMYAGDISSDTENILIDKYGYNG